MTTHRPELEHACYLDVAEYCIIVTEPTIAINIIYIGGSLQLETGITWSGVRTARLASPLQVRPTEAFSRSVHVTDSSFEWTVSIHEAALKHPGCS